MPDPVNETIAALTAAGASDDEITQLVAEKFGKPGGPNSALARANATPLTEPTTFEEGSRQSLLDTASRTGGGIVRGVGHMLNPMTYLSPSGDEHERMRAEATGERAPSTDYGMSDVRDMGATLSTPEGGGEAIGSLLAGLAGPRLMTKGAAKIPAARQAVGGAIERAGTAMDAGGPVGAISRNAVGGTVGALAGGPVGAAIGGAAGVAAPAVVRGAGRLIRGRVPPAAVAAEAAPIAEAAAPLAAEPGPMLGPSPKPKLAAHEVAAMLREQYGSEKAGRMLYGKGKGGHLPPAERQAAIKRLAPGESALPANAARQMDAALEGATPADAYAYAQKAPNAMAQDYFGDRLRGIPKAAQEAEIRRILTEMMRGK